MASKSPQSKWRDGAFSTLNMAIEALNLAKAASSVTPAKDVFGSVSVLLTIIRVRCLLFCCGGPLVHTYAGLNGKRSGLCRNWDELRRCM